MQELFDCHARLVFASLDCVKWSCLYSGLGIIQPLTKKETELLAGLDPANPQTEFYLKNHVPLCCMYEGGTPTFAPPVRDVLNPGKFMWNDKSQKKEIHVESQAFAISSLCLAASRVNPSHLVERALHQHSAILIHEFASTYLRNDDGLFVNATDKTKGVGRPKIKQDTGQAIPFHQAAMLEATLHLCFITSDQMLLSDLKKDHIGNIALEAHNLVAYMRHNLALYLAQPTKQLADTVSLLCRCISIKRKPSDEIQNALEGLLLPLSAELSSRVRITGEVENPFDAMDSNLVQVSTSASITTAFKAEAALLESSRLTGLTPFRDAALRIHDYLADLYDPVSHSYHDYSSTELRLSIADAADILKCLQLHYKMTNDQSSLRHFREIHTLAFGCFQANQLAENPHTNTNSSYGTSVLIQSASSRKFHVAADVDVDADINVDEHVKVVDVGITEPGTNRADNSRHEFSTLPARLMEETGLAPVFMKNFKRKFSDAEDKEIHVSRHFSSKSAFYATLQLLLYLDGV